MPIQPRFQAAVLTLAELAAPTNPGYIAVKAACKLAELLSPAHPRHHDIMRLLNQPAEEAPADETGHDATGEDDPSTHGEEDEPP
jgi:hypothetical protein